MGFLTCSTVLNCQHKASEKKAMATANTATPVEVAVVKAVQVGKQPHPAQAGQAAEGDTVMGLLTVRSVYKVSSERAGTPSG
jgi:hypothetical protein